jgi:hypothetical protein
VTQAIFKAATLSTDKVVVLFFVLGTVMPRNVILSKQQNLSLQIKHKDFPFVETQKYSSVHIP